jgi:hypothetical protein
VREKTNYFFGYVTKFSYFCSDEQEREADKAIQDFTERLHL